MRRIRLTKQYLWFPVCPENPLKLVTLFSGEKPEEKWREFQIPWPEPGQQPEFWAAVPTAPFTGREAVLCGDFLPQRLEEVRLEDFRPQPDPRRPVWHLSPEHGWMNDPNGLILENGLYHCYYQYHPFGLKWGPMYWNHGVSRDLLHWETREIALFPDETGTMYSGCGFRDTQGTAGFGENALLFYYTAAGGMNPWSMDEPFTQRLAVSRDGGETLEKQGCVLPHIAGENRDPMVFWHEESQSYCMVLYLEGNTFALFRSSDLLHWEESQRLELPGAWECPALFPLWPEGEEERWVFWTADGFYWVGSFDGFRFTPLQPVKKAYGCAIPYAAQCFAGVSGKTLQMTWLRLPNGGTEFTGMMAVPAELSLVRREGEWVLRTKAAVDWEALGAEVLRMPWEDPPRTWQDFRQDVPFVLEGQAEGSVRLFQNQREVLRISPKEGLVCLGGETAQAEPSFLKGAFQLIVDKGVLELRAGDGLFWMAAPGEISLAGQWRWEREEKKEEPQR